MQAKLQSQQLIYKHRQNHRQKSDSVPVIISKTIKKEEKLEETKELAREQEKNVHEKPDKINTEIEKYIINYGTG